MCSVHAIHAGTLLIILLYLLSLKENEYLLDLVVSVRNFISVFTGEK